MAGIIQEYSSPRSDNGVLTWHEGETFIIPFKFSITTEQGEPYDIGPDDIVTLFIKEDRRLIERIYERQYTDVKENLILFEVNPSLSKLLCRGKYVLYVKLNYGNDELNLISNLPIKVNP